MFKQCLIRFILTWAWQTFLLIKYYTNWRTEQRFKFLLAISWISYLVLHQFHSCNLPLKSKYHLQGQGLSPCHHQMEWNSHRENLRFHSKKAMSSKCISTWWRHQMETFSTLLALCAGNSPVPGEFPTQRPVMRSFDVYFDLRPNKRLSKQSWGWWFETL